MYNKITNTSLALFSVFVGIYISHLILQRGKLPFDSVGVLVLGGGPLSSDPQTGIRSYKPSRSYFSARVFGDKVEAKYNFRTNQYGFRETYKCPAAELLDGPVVFVGDSFTEGYGASKVWTEDTQELLCTNLKNSFNLGMSGTGVLDMARNAVFAKSELNASKVVFAIIPEDVSRGSYPFKSNSICSGWVDGVTGKKLHCESTGDYLHVSLNATDDDLIAFANQKIKYGLPIVLRDFREILRRTFTPAKRIFIPSKSEEMGSMIRSESIKAYEKITELYGVDNVMLIILPTKVSLGLRKIPPFDLASHTTNISLFKKMAERKTKVIDLRGNCKLANADFHERDGHPNARGQDKLGKCILSYHKYVGFLDSGN